MNHAARLQISQASARVEDVREGPGVGEQPRLPQPPVEIQGFCEHSTLGVGSDDRIPEKYIVLRVSGAGEYPARGGHIPGSGVSADELSAEERGAGEAGSRQQAVDAAEAFVGFRA